MADLNRAMGARALRSAAAAPAAISEAAFSSASAAVPSLANYEDPCLSPLRSADLLASARDFRQNFFFPLFSRRVDEELEASGVGAVGISVNFLSQALCAFAIIGYLRTVYPRLRLAIGGGLVNSWVAAGLLRSGSLRSGLPGAGSGVRDDFLGSLVDAVLPGKGEDSLPGFLGFARTAGSAPPDFACFDLSRYFAPVRILPYNLSVGCPWKKCVFCPETAEDAPYLPLGSETAYSELAGLVRSWSPGLIHFTDSEFSPRHLRDLVRDPPGVPWYGFARFAPPLDSGDFCRCLAAAGCRMLQLGLESADQRVLDAMGKGTDLPVIERILANLAEAGIAAYLYVLFGTSAENLSSALMTRDFVAAHSAEIGFLNVAVFNLPIGGAETRTLKTKAFYEGDLSLYREFEHPEGWNRDAVRAFLARDFAPEPRIKAVLKRNPPVFTSNHAPFFPFR
ncbi:MAG TPA: radical SAM protein [Treponema sp.]|nr:radical SAM protein [Treponema sp.]